MIVLFTDFGAGGPYLGQVSAILARDAPGVPIITLFADAPPFDPQAAAYLLAAYVAEFVPATVFLCVVDPGVGGDRKPVAVEADGRRFVGPDNGLFEIVLRRAAEARAWILTWRPDRLSASFHGRDIFAPVAARLARGEEPPGDPCSPALLRRPDWPEDLSRVVYVDAYGNAMTGLRAATLGPATAVRAGGRRLTRARTFSDRASGEPFWYENANGLLELAVNRGSAARLLGLAPGDPITLEPA